MAVPAHDDRDREFAEDFHLPMIPVISEEGILINSAQFNGLSAETGKAAVVEAAKVKWRIKVVMSHDVM